MIRSPVKDGILKITTSFICGAFVMLILQKNHSFKASSGPQVQILWDQMDEPLLGKAIDFYFPQCRIGFNRLRVDSGRTFVATVHPSDLSRLLQLPFEKKDHQHVQVAPVESLLHLPLCIPDEKHITR